MLGTIPSKITWYCTRGFVRAGNARSVKEFPTFSAALEWAKIRSAEKPNVLFFVGGEGVRPASAERPARLVNYRGRYVRAGKSLKKRQPGV